MVLAGLSSMISPPVGNSLAGIHPGWPFVIWAGLGMLGFVSLLCVRDGM